jgi:hypothetical protein
MAVYQPLLTSPLPEWLMDRAYASGLAIAATTLAAEIPLSNGNTPNVFNYYLSVMNAVQPWSTAGVIRLTATCTARIG